MGKSIFDIEKDKLALFEELEDNGGEITPELEEALQLNEQETTSKVKQYVEYITKLKGDIATIKAEKDRLDKLAKSKENTLKSITNLVVYAIKHFGNEDKKGKKYFDWTTGKVSIRESTAVEVDSTKLDAMAEAMSNTFANGIFTGELNCHDSIDEESIIDALQHHCDPINGYEDPIDIETEDIDDVTIEVTVPVKMRDLMSGNGYQLMTNVGAVSPNVWKFKPTVDKKAMKTKIVDEGCSSNIAKVVTNESLNIR